MLEVISLDTGVQHVYKRYYTHIGIKQYFWIMPESVILIFVVIFICRIRGILYCCTNQKRRIFADELNTIGIVVCIIDDVPNITLETCTAWCVSSRDLIIIVIVVAAISSSNITAALYGFRFTILLDRFLLYSIVYYAGGWAAIELYKSDCWDFDGGGVSKRAVFNTNRLLHTHAQASEIISSRIKRGNRGHQSVYRK